jgi:hypothetical protein
VWLALVFLVVTVIVIVVVIVFVIVVVVTRQATDQSVISLNRSGQEQVSRVLVHNNLSFRKMKLFHDSKHQH